MKYTYLTEPKKEDQQNVSNMNYLILEEKFSFKLMGRYLKNLFLIFITIILYNNPPIVVILWIQIQSSYTAYVILFTDFSLFKNYIYAIKEMFFMFYLFVYCFYQALNKSVEAMESLFIATYIIGLSISLFFFIFDFFQRFRNKNERIF